MNNLSKMHCKSCEGLEDSLSPENQQKYLSFIKGWTISEKKLTKTFKFKDFKSALSFVNKVGEISEQEHHHPNINFTWGVVEITLFTHALNGLSMNDFILASKIDQIPT